MMLSQKVIRKANCQTMKNQTSILRKSQDLSMNIYDIDRKRYKIDEPNELTPILQILEQLYHYTQVFEKEKYSFLFSQIIFYLNNNITNANQIILKSIQEIVKKKSGNPKDKYFNKKDYEKFLENHPNNEDLIINVMNSILERLSKYKIKPIKVKDERDEFNKNHPNQAEKFQKYLVNKDYPEELDLINELKAEWEKIGNHLLIYQKNEKLNEIRILIYVAYSNRGGTKKLIHASKIKAKNLNCDIIQKEQAYGLTEQVQPKEQVLKKQQMIYNLDQQKFRQTEQNDNMSSDNNTIPILRKFSENDFIYESEDYQNVEYGFEK